MRVLLTSHSPLQGSPSGDYLLDLANGLRAAGHEVRALIVDRKSTGDAPFPVERVVARAGDSQADLDFDLPGFANCAASGHTFDDLNQQQVARYLDVNRARLDRVVAEFDPHIIHAQHVWLHAHLALETGVPYVATATGADLLAYRQDGRYRSYAEQAAENAGHIVSTSESVRGEVLGTFDVPAERVSTLYSAIDPAPFAPAKLTREQALTRLGLSGDHGTIVACVGQLTPLQGIETLLNAAAVYEFDPFQIITLIAGDGPQRPELEAHAQRLGLERVRFLGQLDRETRAALYSVAELVVLPSRGLPFNTTVLEALASGTPIIGAAASGVDEILPESVGAIVRSDDHELLAERVLLALAKNWKATKGPQARKHVLEHHGLDAHVKRIASIYRRVLEERFGGQDWLAR